VRASASACASCSPLGAAIPRIALPACNRTPMFRGFPPTSAKAAGPERYTTVAVEVSRIMQQQMLGCPAAFGGRELLIDHRRKHTDRTAYRPWSQETATAAEYRARPRHRQAPATQSPQITGFRDTGGAAAPEPRAARKARRCAVSHRCRYVVTIELPAWPAPTIATSPPTPISPGFRGDGNSRARSAAATLLAR